MNWKKSDTDARTTHAHARAVEAEAATGRTIVTTDLPLPVLAAGSQCVACCNHASHACASAAACTHMFDDAVRVSHSMNNGNFDLQIKRRKCRAGQACLCKKPGWTTLRAFYSGEEHAGFRATGDAYLADLNGKMQSLQSLAQAAMEQ